ncbi:thermonuclease family protein [Sporohalobacter salinus]|uniref:thermonuclease family protein n=1 Tax=Sporohalobacter salinus TaxID=1494606 RepID=UPI001EF96593|nr:thermonuclease family protein [Sporohalobacter salinus]MBM7624865.1 micrococcal nuclease [Sporohalobacter salinus]
MLLMRKFLSLFLSVIIISTFNISAIALEINEDLKIKQNKVRNLDEIYVAKVIDGDTIKTAAGKKIRFIGVDTPEIGSFNKKVEYYGKKASKFTTEKLEGKMVYLDYDVKKYDKYKRILAYVFLKDGTFFNAKLLKAGYAELLTMPPNVNYVELFKELVKEARENKRGLWDKDKDSDKQLPIISWKKADEYIGKKVIIKGEVIDTYDSGEAIFLNFSKEYWNTFSAVIFSRDEYKFSINPTQYYLHKKVRIKGKIKKYKEAPEIIIQEPVQIKIED